MTSLSGTDTSRPQCRRYGKSGDLARRRRAAARRRPPSPPAGSAPASAEPGRSVAVGAVDLLLRQPVSPAEAGAFEMRVAEVGAFEMRVAEVGAFEMRREEVGAFEMRGAEGGALEIGETEIGALEIALEKPLIGQIRPNQIERTARRPGTRDQYRTDQPRPDAQGRLRPPGQPA